MMNNAMEPQQQQKLRNPLVTLDDLAERVDQLEAEKSELTLTADELRRVLTELVEACEAGGTVRYMAALGTARRSLDTNPVLPNRSR